MKEIDRFQHAGQEPILWETDGTTHFISWGSRAFDTDHLPDAGATYGSWIAEALDRPRIAGAGEYRVYWAIDLNADSPVDAARAARQMQINSESTATFFEVERVDENDRLSGVKIPVDLDAVGPDGKGFHPYHGEGMPVTLDTCVEVRTRKGEYFESSAREFDWGRYGEPEDIVEFRILEEEVSE